MKCKEKTNEEKDNAKGRQFNWLWDGTIESQLWTRPKVNSGSMPFRPNLLHFIFSFGSRWMIPANKDKPNEERKMRSQLCREFNKCHGGGTYSYTGLIQIGKWKCLKAGKRFNFIHFIYFHIFTVRD
jgi:hypothetical protein